MCRDGGQRQRETGDYRVTGAHGCRLAVYTQTSAGLRVKAGGWISVFAAARGIPHRPLSDSHIIQCRKSCSSFINIRPCSQKNPGTADSERKKKYMAVCAAGRVFIIIAGEAAVVVVGCEFGSRITAVGCLLEPDNVVFVYC